MGRHPGSGLLGRRRGSWGDALTRVRLAAGLSQLQAAERLGIERKTLNRLELGRCEPFLRWGAFEGVINVALLAEFRRQLKPAGKGRAGK